MMKILIYGAGVVGSTYGWQLSKVGCDVSVLVKPNRKEDIEQHGINISCIDYRNKIKTKQQVVFSPKVIDTLSSNNDYEYIIVSTNSDSLKNILPILSKSSGKAHILFFQNIWDDFDLISKYLPPDRYFFGFPFMVGGGRDGNNITSVISGMRQSNTPIGELDGKQTPRLIKIANVLSKADLKPLIFKNIKTWLITHYAVAAGLSGGIMFAGSGKSFANDSDILKQTIKAIREGLSICQKRGFDPKLIVANKFYFLPMWLTVPIAKKVFSNEALCQMFDGHIKHSPAEMKEMIEDTIRFGQQFSMQVPNLKKILRMNK